jgi:hypothetical protein
LVVLAARSPGTFFTVSFVCVIETSCAAAL